MPPAQPNACAQQPARVAEPERLRRRAQRRAAVPGDPARAAPRAASSSSGVRHHPRDDARASAPRPRVSGSPREQDLGGDAGEQSRGQEGARGRRAARRAGSRAARTGALAGDDDVRRLHELEPAAQAAPAHRGDDGQREVASARDRVAGTRGSSPRSRAAGARPRRRRPRSACPRPPSSSTRR